MHLQRFEQIEPFWQVAEPFLAQREAEHNLLFGIAGTVLAGNHHYESVYMAIVYEGDMVVAVALRTLPYPLLLSCDVPDEAIRLLVDDLHAFNPSLSGVTADKATAKRLAEAWSARTGDPHFVKIAMRIYRLTTVQPSPPPAGGSYRAATAAERDLLVGWAVQFGEDILMPMTRKQAERVVDVRLVANPRDEGLRVWEDGGQVVSMAGYTGRTPNGIRINYVYTPPQARKRGYAGACVAQMSQELLDMGYQFCFLFTDLGNPTSNHIYQVLGYEPISDVDQVWFGEGG
jgi:predicted GNAT family acetyltransferase